MFDADFRAVVGANLVFARPGNAKIRIAEFICCYLTWYSFFDMI